MEHDFLQQVAEVGGRNSDREFSRHAEVEDISVSRVEVCLLFGQSLPACGVFLGAGLAVVLIDYILAFGLDVSDGDIEGEAIEVPALTLHFDDES